MKKHIVLFAIFITAIFLYPVFAHAGSTGYLFTKNPVSEPIALLALGLGLLIAGAKYQGEFEERLKSVLKAVKESDKQVVFIQK